MPKSPGRFSPGKIGSFPTSIISPYLEKPPLVYWLTALSFKVLGFTELAARLPSAAERPGRPVSGLWPGADPVGAVAGLR